jgi:hypothetical protein
MQPVIAAALAYNREPVSLGQPPEIGLESQRRKRSRARLDGFGAARLRLCADRCQLRTWLAWAGNQESQQARYAGRSVSVRIGVAYL